MKPLSQQTLAQLAKTKTALLEELRNLSKQADLLVNELVLVDARIDARRGKGGGPYSGIRGVIEAVEMLLTDTKRWMTKDEVFEGLHAGGFSLQPESGYKIVTSTLNSFSKKDPNKKQRLVRHGDTFGLPSFKKPE